MNIETNRLNTFTDWPITARVDPIRVAKAGFFYTGHGTEVQCFSCGGKISDWNYGDQAMWRHRNLEPNCAFVLNPQTSGNVPLVLASEYPDVLSPRRDTFDYGITEDDVMYQSDPLRLLSFINWTDTSVSRQALVNAGFYNAGDGRIRCAFCGGELSTFINFGSMGHPSDFHRTYFPRCPRSAPTIVRRAIQDPPTINAQSSGAAHNERVLSAGATWRNLGVVGGGARHASLAALASRLATFHRWPADRTQTPRALAEAGFFYTGTDDQVRCFYCDGGLGKWERGDTPWAEHARWFPHCGFVLLVKGQQFVDTHRPSSTPTTTENTVPNRRQNSNVNFPVEERQVTASMESELALSALGAGLDAARVRRAIVRRLRTTGLPFASSEALIDAVLDEQLNEEPWSVTPQSQRLARDILAETLRDFGPRAGIIPQSSNDSSSDSRVSPPSSPTRSPTREPSGNSQNVPESSRNSQIIPALSRNAQNIPERSRNSQIIPELSRNVQNLSELSRNAQNISQPSKTTEKTEQPDTSNGSGNNNDFEENGTEESVRKEDSGDKQLTLEEENRQLKEARLCKVCMDSEVSVVFLPCGHLVSCGGCGAALPACPLCRAAVRALVRAYLA